MTRYLDPKTAFGFKWLFAQEDSKDIDIELIAEFTGLDMTVLHRIVP